MRKIIRANSIIAAVLPFLVMSCISSKKHLEEIANLQTDHDAKRTQLNYLLDAANYKNDSLGLVIAQKEGENKALLTVQDKLQDRIDDLQDQIENVTDLALSQKQSLRETIEDKEQVLADKEEKIGELHYLLSDSEAAVQNMLRSFQDSLLHLDSLGLVNFKVSGNELHLVIRSSVFFSKGRHRINTKRGSSSAQTLRAISGLMARNPDQYLNIIGHTDNTPPNSRSYRDNWDLSALQASSIAQSLIDEFETNPNQVTISGKGESIPTTSNETEEGKEQNRRIQFVVSKGNNVLLRNIKRKMETLGLN